MLLEDIIRHQRYSFHESFDSWEEAIRANYQPLVAEGVVNEIYIQAVIDCVHEHGPYIVIAPDIAMPHSTENAEGVNDTAIVFMKVEQPVQFDKDDREKDARLFFGLASVDAQQHLNNIMELSELLMDEDFVAELLKVSNEEEFKELALERC